MARKIIDGMLECLGGHMAPVASFRAKVAPRYSSNAKQSYCRPCEAEQQRKRYGIPPPIMADEGMQTVTKMEWV